MQMLRPARVNKIYSYYKLAKAYQILKRLIYVSLNCISDK